MKMELVSGGSVLNASPSSAGGRKNGKSVGSVCELWAQSHCELFKKAMPGSSIPSSGGQAASD